jgi:hypothetical protein
MSGEKPAAAQIPDQGGDPGRERPDPDAPDAAVGPGVERPPGPLGQLAHALGVIEQQPGLAGQPDPAGRPGVATLAGFAVSGSDLGAAGEVLAVVICSAPGPAVTLPQGWPGHWPSPSVLASLAVLGVVCSAAALP